MAEHTYLKIISNPSSKGRSRFLMMAKRNVPIAWVLPFVQTDRVAVDRLVCSVPDGLARARKRAKTIERVWVWLFCDGGKSRKIPLFDDAKTRLRDRIRHESVGVT
jgi:hypothetical protein